MAVAAATASSPETADLAELVEAPALGEVQETVEVAVAPDNFLTKPFDDYTTTEGLLFCIFVSLVCAFLGRFLGRCTSWL